MVYGSYRDERLGDSSTIVKLSDFRIMNSAYVNNNDDDGFEC